MNLYGYEHLNFVVKTFESKEFRESDSESFSDNGRPNKYNRIGGTFNDLKEDNNHIQGVSHILDSTPNTPNYSDSNEFNDFNRIDGSSWFNGILGGVWFAEFNFPVDLKSFKKIVLETIYKINPEIKEIGKYTPSVKPIVGNQTNKKKNIKEVIENCCPISYNFDNGVYSVQNEQNGQDKHNKYNDSSFLLSLSGLPPSDSSTLVLNDYKENKINGSTQHLNSFKHFNGNFKYNDKDECDYFIESESAYLTKKIFDSIESSDIFSPKNKRIHRKQNNEKKSYEYNDGYTDTNNNRYIWVVSDEEDRECRVREAELDYLEYEKEIEFRYEDKNIEEYEQKEVEKTNLDKVEVENSGNFRDILVEKYDSKYQEDEGTSYENPILIEEDNEEEYMEYLSEEIEEKEDGTDSPWILPVRYKTKNQKEKGDIGDNVGKRGGKRKIKIENELRIKGRIRGKNKDDKGRKETESNEYKKKYTETDNSIGSIYNRNRSIKKNKQIINNNNKMGYGRITKHGTIDRRYKKPLEILEQVEIGEKVKDRDNKQIKRNKDREVEKEQETENKELEKQVGGIWDESFLRTEYFNKMLVNCPYLGGPNINDKERTKIKAKNIVDKLVEEGMKKRKLGNYKSISTNDSRDNINNSNKENNKPEEIVDKEHVELIEYQQKEQQEIEKTNLDKVECNKLEELVENVLETPVDNINEQYVVETFESKEEEDKEVVIIDNIEEYGGIQSLQDFQDTIKYTNYRDIEEKYDINNEMNDLRNISKYNYSINFRNFLKLNRTKLIRKNNDYNLRNSNKNNNEVNKFNGIREVMDGIENLREYGNIRKEGDTRSKDNIIKENIGINKTITDNIYVPEQESERLNELDEPYVNKIKFYGYDEDLLSLKIIRKRRTKKGDNKDMIGEDNKEKEVGRVYKKLDSINNKEYKNLEEKHNEQSEIDDYISSNSTSRKDSINIDSNNKSNKTRNKLRNSTIRNISKNKMGGNIEKKQIQVKKAVVTNKRFRRKKSFLLKLNELIDQLTSEQIMKKKAEIACDIYHGPMLNTDQTDFTHIYRGNMCDFLDKPRVTIKGHGLYLKQKMLGTPLDVESTLRNAFRVPETEYQRINNREIIKRMLRDY